MALSATKRGLRRLPLAVTLVQDIMTGLDLPRLVADTGPIQRWLFEDSSITAAVLAIAALFAFIIFNRRAQAKRGAIVGGVMLLAAAGVLVTGYLVVTPRENLLKKSRQWVRSVAEADPQAAAGLLSEDVIVSTRGDVIDRLDKDWIIDIIDGFDDIVEGYTIFQTSAVLDSSIYGRTQLGVRVRTKQLGGGITPTTWELHWRRERDGSWRLLQLDCLTIYGQSPMPRWANYANELSD